MSPLPTALLDASWRVGRRNPAWTHVFGDAPGASWIDLVHPEDLARDLSGLGDLQRGNIPNLRICSRLHSNQGIWLPCEIVLASAPDGGFLAIILPVAAALPVAVPEVADDHRQLAAALSHDVLQHARLATAYCSLLARSQLDHRQLAQVAVIADHADRLQQLLAALVRWLRLLDEQPQRQPCDLDQVWRAVISDLPADFHPAALPTILADPVLMTELLRELAVNAVRYHPGRARIACSVQRRVDCWLIMITDDGLGIPAADRQRVLAPLHRLHSWEQVPGHGMGLALAERIVVRHCGSLSIHEAAGGGCMVQVMIPL